MNVNSRQKIIIPLLAIVLLILGWQIYKMAGTNDYVPVPNSINNKNMQSLATPTPAPVAFNPVNQNQITLNPDQAEYIRLVNQYQLMSMERMVAQSSREIAEAKLKTAEARNQLDKLAQLSDDDAPNPVAVKSTDPAALQLVYTGRQNGQWSATLRKGQDLMDVTVGDAIPDDGRVVAINADNVTLQNNGASKVVTFRGVMQRDSEVIKKFSQANQNPNQQNSVAAVNNSQPGLNTLTPLESNKTPANLVETAAQKPQAPTTIAPANVNKQESKVDNKPVVETPEKVTAVKTEKSVAVEIPKNIAAPKNNLLSNTSKENINKQMTSANENKSPFPGGISSHTNMSKEPNQNVAKVSEKKPLSNKEAKVDKSTYYTVQIIADDKREEIKQFLINHGLQDRGTIHQVNKHGKNWYVATIGEYDTADKANKSLQSLPKNLGRWKPFVRTSKDLA